MHTDGRYGPGWYLGRSQVAATLPEGGWKPGGGGGGGKEGRKAEEEEEEEEEEEGRRKKKVGLAAWQSVSGRGVGQSTPGIVAACHRGGGGPRGRVATKGTRRGKYATS
ncbi:hypothetical protein KM043_003660 [Ampulex compressa]|nr:hypothetical protein KM043_003660 [Ampulex compressa]